MIGRRIIAKQKNILREEAKRAANVINRRKISVYRDNEVIKELTKVRSALVAAHQKKNPKPTNKQTLFDEPWRY